MYLRGSRYQNFNNFVEKGEKKRKTEANESDLPENKQRLPLAPIL